MSELFQAMLAAKDRILTLLVLALAVMIVTYVIYVVSGKSSILKYLPGLLLVGAGIYYLYQGFQNITTRAGLNEFMSAVIFGIIGLVGLSYALILGIYHQGVGQKTKRRAQALDYLQEARSGEEVNYAKKKEEDYKENPVSLGPIKQRPVERPEDCVEQPVVQKKETTTVKQKTSDAPDQQQKRETRARKEEQRQKNATEDRPVQDVGYDVVAAKIDQEYEDKRERLHLRRLEQQLEHKNKQRAARHAYNQRAKALNEQEEISYKDQLPLTMQRVKIQSEKLFSNQVERVRRHKVDWDIFWQKTIAKANARIRLLFDDKH